MRQSVVTCLKKIADEFSLNEKVVNEQVNGANTDKKVIVKPNKVEYVEMNNILMINKKACEKNISFFSKENSEKKELLNEKVLSLFEKESEFLFSS